MASTNRSARAAAIDDMKAQEAGDPMAALDGALAFDQAAQAVPAAAPGGNPWDEKLGKTKDRFESLMRLFGGLGG